MTDNQTEHWGNPIEANNIFRDIYNPRIEKELLRNLRLNKPAFANWNFMVGSFVFADLTDEEIMNIFDTYCKAETYDRRKTKDFIKSYRHKYDLSDMSVDAPCSSGTHLPSFPKSKATQKTFTKGIDVINHFFSHTQPVLPMDIPEDTLEAAHVYYKHGYTPLPKHPTDKHPGVCYAHYRNNRFPEEQLDQWEFKYGLCLLGDQTVCYLDIDNHPGKENGTQWLDDHLMRLIHSRHYERTKSNGYHVFGLGDLRSVASVEGIEIKGSTNLIVAYPTEHYKINKYI